MAHVFHLVPPHGIDGLPCRRGVQTVAVGPGDDGRVVGGLGPALDLQTGEARAAQVPQVVDHAHVPGVQDIGALLVLKHREILSRTLLLHQGVLVPAGLGTGAPAGVPAGHIVGEQAPPRVADAHGAVDEGLDLQVRRGLVPDGADFLQTQLPGQDHPAGPQVVPGPGGLVVADAGLGGDVPLTPGGVLPRHGKGPQVRHDQGVHPGVRQPFQVLRQAGRLVVPGHGLDGAVDPDAVAVGKGHRLGQRLIGEVPRKGPHPKAGARQIHCVRAIEHGHFQPLHVPRRGQQLRLVPLNRHRSCC